jgi:hypothetical protein
MATRTNFLPCEALLPLRNALQEHLSEIARHITPENFPGVCNELIFNTLTESFRQAGAHEGSVWILDAAKENLVMAYNTGPNAAKIVGFRQSLKKGYLSMVFANEQSFAESEIFRNARHAKELDQNLKMTTYAMIAVPFYFLKECRGVISCVQLIDVAVEANQIVPTGKKPSGFGIEALSIVQNAALLVRDLINYNLLKTTVGWN